MNLNALLRQLNFEPVSIDDSVIIQGYPRWLIVNIVRSVTGIHEQGLYFDEHSLFQYRPFRGYMKNTISRNAMIRELQSYGVRQTLLSTYFNMSQSMISKIVKAGDTDG